MKTKGWDGGKWMATGVQFGRGPCALFKRRSKFYPGQSLPGWYVPLVIIRSSFIQYCSPSLTGLEHLSGAATSVRAKTLEA